MLESLILANVAEDIVAAVQSYVGPILLLIIGIISITFLMRREVMALVIFLVIGIVVAILFYAPGVIKSIALAFTGETGLDSNWNG